MGFKIVGNKCWLVTAIHYILHFNKSRTNNKSNKICFNHFRINFGQRLVGISYQMVSKFIEPNKR